MRRNRSLLCVLLLSLAGLQGCAWSVGGRAEDSSAPTLARELEDLEAAHEKGILTDEEFQRTRELLLAGAAQRG